MIFENPYWSTQTKLDLLARWLIVHSIIYYELDSTIIPDSMWDFNARQYLTLRKQDRHKGSTTRWNYVMYDFDGTTGFHLFTRLKPEDQHRLMQIAQNLVYRAKNKSRGGDANASKRKIIARRR